MNPATQKIAEETAEDFLILISRIQAQTFELLEQAQLIPTCVHFHDVREIQKRFSGLAKKLEGIVDQLSEEVLPTMFMNNGVKNSLPLVGIGRINIGTSWHCSMSQPVLGRAWLKNNGQGALVIETVNSQRLTAHAHHRFVEGKPLPEDLFKVTTTHWTSITKD